MPLRYATERDKKYRILDLTSLTVEEFEALIPTFQTAFLAYMAERIGRWRANRAPDGAIASMPLVRCPRLKTACCLC